MKNIEIGGFMYKVVSLFSGCGGLDLGLEGGFIDVATKRKLPKTGLTTIFANDIRPGAKIAWENYFKRDDIYHLDSIVDLIHQHREGKFTFPKADIVTGGFPCQDFSVAGKRLGFNSSVSHSGNKFKETEIEEASVKNRGQLYMWMMEAINIIQPNIFIAENVKGLTNLDDVYKIIKNDFSSLGYKVFTKVVNAKHYGVAQNRERVIFMGFKSEALVTEDINPFPTPLYSNDSFISVKQVLQDLPEPEFSLDPSQKSYSKAKYYGNKVQGQTEVKWNGVAPTIRAEHHGNIEFRRLSKEHGGVTLDGEERRLTVRECARLQSFPDEYEFVQNGVSASEAYKIIGNAVPPVLAYNIGMHISKNWSTWFTTEKKANHEQIPLFLAE
ncbi:hypothetical protein BW721_10650 [Jeotgalibaca sp. PTS2502]|nr:hypothetical protein BW721_10650 [Jeotgalibaca sp. PTS2502]